MAVKCKDCGFVNKDESIYQLDESGKPVFVGGRNAPFRCVRCGSEKIVPFDE